MTDDSRVWVRRVDVHREVDLAVGRHVVVGDDDADRKVARIVAIDSDGNLDLEVLPATVELLARA